MRPLLVGLTFALFMASSAMADMVRVCQNLDGTVRVIQPNPRLKEPTETDAQFVARIGDKTIAGDLSLQGLACNDVDKVSLPIRVRTDSQGDKDNVRNSWRWNGTAVVVDDTKSNPRWEAFVDRVNKSLSVNARVQVAPLLLLLERAVKENNSQLMQRIYDRLQQSVDLSAAEKDAIKQTIIEKKIPITP